MNTVAVIIVTFNPCLTTLERLIDNVSSENVPLIIVDNNSDCVELIRNKVLEFKCTNFVSLANNEGIAKAQNIGIAEAMLLSVDYVLFFDQDSTINEGFVDKLRREYINLSSMKKTPVILGPVFYDSRYGFEYPQIKFNKFGFRRKFTTKSLKEPQEVSCIISSGMFVDINIFKKVGLMDEQLFIDYVDTEWCLRATQSGYQCYVSPLISMDHEIGIANIKLLKWRVPVHSAFRRYYRIRNSYYLLRYTHVPKIMAIREIIFSIVHQLILILLGAGGARAKQILTLFKASFDGCFSSFKSKKKL